MFAIGLVLFFAGWFIANTFGLPYILNSLGKHNAGDYIGGFCGLVGVVLIVISAARWLWAVMP